MTSYQLLWGRADLQITSFKHTSSAKKALALRTRRCLIPILPNSTASASRLRLQMQPDATLHRESWANLARTFVVGATMIKSYDHNLPSLRYKLAPSSIADVQIMLGLPAPARSCTARYDAGQDDVVDDASNATTEPSPRTRQAVVAAGQALSSDRTALMGGTPRRLSYSAAIHTLPDMRPRNEELNEEAHQQMLPKSTHGGSPRGEESLLLRIYRSLPSWKRVRTWLPSGQTVTTMVVTAALVAAAGGAVYGGYLLTKIVYTPLAACYHGVAAIGIKFIASIVGAWKWCTKILQLFGLEVMKGEKAICGVFQTTIALIKALLGRR